MPPIHLERNPLLHLPARFRKVKRGLAELHRPIEPPDAVVYRDDAVDRLDRLRAAGQYGRSAASFCAETTPGSMISVPSSSCTAVTTVPVACAMLVLSAVPQLGQR